MTSLYHKALKNFNNWLSKKPMAQLEPTTLRVLAPQDQLQQLVGKRVKLSRKYIKNWVLSENKYNIHLNSGIMDEFAQAEYDQEIIIALSMLMGGEVWGRVKGVGDNCLLCHFNATGAGASSWQYVELKDLVFVD